MYFSFFHDSRESGIRGFALNREEPVQWLKANIIAFV